MNGNENDKIVLFPNMVENLLKKAFTAKKEKRYEEAQGHLLPILQFSPRHPVALLTLALILYDAKCFEEAVELFSFMWEENIGKRRQWLPYYLSCLIQLEDYESISLVLHKASKEEEFQDVVDQFQEISKACEILVDGGEEKQFTKEAVLNKIKANPDYHHLLEENLHRGNFEQQLHSIEQLKHIHTDKTVKALKNYLLLDGPEPILKTIALRALKEMGEKGEILIHKFGREYRTRIEDVPLQDQDVPEKEWKVLEIINEMTDKENSSFFSFAFQLWMEYLFSIFPLHPRGHNPASWAAALHYATSRLLHLNQSQKEVARLYGVSVSIVSRKYKSLNDVLVIDARIR
jgi:tetratricopeptide (TPR) repeat protein